MLLLHISAISFGHQREPRLCRGDTKAYGVEESKKEKVSKLE